MFIITDLQFLVNQFVAILQQLFGVPPRIRTLPKSFGDSRAAADTRDTLTWSGYRESNSDVLLGKQSGYLYIIPALN